MPDKIRQLLRPAHILPISAPKIRIVEHYAELRRCKRWVGQVSGAIGTQLERLEVRDCHVASRPEVVAILDGKRGREASVRTMTVAVLMASEPAARSCIKGGPVLPRLGTGAGYDEWHYSETRRRRRRRGMVSRVRYSAGARDTFSHNGLCKVGRSAGSWAS